MPPLVKIQDQDILVETVKYPYAKWNFPHFNPVQSAIFDQYALNRNGLVAAATSAGKTVVAEMFLANEVRKRGGKGMFLAPLRALAREKIMDWKNPKSHFADLKISICTGDYRLTKERIKELEEADIIIMTSEMLNHRSRNYKSEQNKFLLDVGTIVVDESHLLTVPGRGDHLEVGLMKFTEINEKARIVLLSATMPNVEEIAEWVSYSLTKRETFVIESKYRPVPLTIHYENYVDFGRYDQVEDNKIKSALNIVMDYPNDKFLIFAHTKRTGEKMKKALIDRKINCQFHNADLEANERIKVEDDFRNNSSLRCIVATSTLAWGLNLPARRVIILGVHRAMTEVESYDILQMVGRSGRLGIDPRGDAYILVPQKNAEYYRKKYSKPSPIESQLLEHSNQNHKTLAFHLVNEIYHGDIQTTDDVHNWYERSLAHFQSKELDGSTADKTLELLRKCGAIFQQDDGVWTCCAIGKVSSLFYYSPFDASALYFNFKELFSEKRENNDLFLAMALANTDSARSGIISKAEKDEISLFTERVYTNIRDKFFVEPVLKVGYCYYNLLTGKDAAINAATQRNLQVDFPRVAQVLLALDSMGANWQMSEFFKNLEGRIFSGVPVHLVELCKMPQVGKVRATKLFDSGIKSLIDVAKMDFERFKKMTNMKDDLARAAYEFAKKTKA